MGHAERTGSKPQNKQVIIEAIRGYSPRICPNKGGVVVGRPRKQTVDYFPHFVTTDSRTKFILEQSWGNDGYAFWFKLLELLGRSEGHCYDCSEAANKKYLVALMKIDESTIDEILEVLADLGNIDRELWDEHKIIWCQSLVDNLADVYSKRTVSAPKRPLTAPEPPAPAEEPEPRKRGRPKKAENEKAGAGGTRGVYEEIAELYNAICVSFPKIRSLSEARKKAIKARMANGYTVESFKELFTKAEASSFLKGKNDRNWQATFDWLIKDSNMAKVIDGNYDDKGGGSYGPYPDRGNFGRSAGAGGPGEFKPSGGFKGNE